MIQKGLALFCFCLSFAHATYFSIQRDLTINQDYSDPPDNAFYNTKVAAIAEFTDNTQVDGWTYYYIKTSGVDPDWYQMYLAGYMEGNLAYQYIWDNYLNSKIFLSDMNANVINFIHSQTSWMQSQISANPHNTYWNLVNASLSQVYGMHDGYLAAIQSARRPDMNLTFDNFYTLTYMSDLFDVMAKFNGGVNLRPPKSSFLAKMTGDSLFVSHSTGFDYNGLLRTYKVLDLNLENPVALTKRVSFSSQPGYASSQDDFYILDNSRVVAETALSTDNIEVYDFIQYESVPYWIRVTVANFAFDNQETWANTYFNHRSGTYNSQWLLIDFGSYNTSKSNPSAAKNVIWIAEEFFALSNASDVTQELLVPQGYVASYNVPYDPDIQSISQSPTSYQNDPRAMLFAKYAPGVQTIDDFKNVMRLNNVTDTGDYCEAIAPRCDLSDKIDFPRGAIDCKVTSDTLVSTHQAWIISGPTSDNIPPFTWSDWPQYNTSRNGIVTLWDFDWIFMDPNSNFSLTAKGFPQPLAF